MPLRAPIARPKRHQNDTVSRRGRRGRRRLDKIYANAELTCVLTEGAEAEAEATTEEEEAERMFAPQKAANKKINGNKSRASNGKTFDILKPNNCATEPASRRINLASFLVSFVVLCSMRAIGNMRAQQCAGSTVRPARMFCSFFWLLVLVWRAF